MGGSIRVNSCSDAGSWHDTVATAPTLLVASPSSVCTSHNTCVF
jgi:hypothetical protein